MAEKLNYASRRGRRRFSWLILGIGILLILGWNLCQKETWKTLLSLTDANRVPPDWMERSEDISRTDRLLVGLTPEILEDVKDHAPIKAAETRIVMKLWNQLYSMDLQSIEKASLGKVLFAQYLKQPRAYRGCVIRIRGTIRLIVPKTIPQILRKSPENTEEPDFGYDFSQYYELWIQPDDNPAEPVLVNTLQIPESLPLNEQIYIPVVIDGVFFKHYVYEGQEGMCSAPTFYAKSPLWLYAKIQDAAISAAQKKPLRIPFIYIVAGALILAGIFLRYVEKRTKVEPGEPLPEKFELPE